jgi:site-specific recombinase XerD
VTALSSRLRSIGLPRPPHSCCRVTTITDLLKQRVPTEDVQYLAGHSDVRTTQLYDRPSKLESCR